MHSFIYIQLQIYIYIPQKSTKRFPQVLSCVIEQFSLSLGSFCSTRCNWRCRSLTSAHDQGHFRTVNQWKNKLILWNKYGKKGWKKKQTNQTKDVQYYTVIDEIHDIHCTPKSHGSRMIEVNHGGRMWAPYRKHNPHFGRGQLLWDMQDVPFVSFCPQRMSKVSKPHKLKPPQ